MLVCAARLLMLLILWLSMSSCAVFMADEGHVGGTGQLSDAAGRAQADSLKKYRTPPPDVGYTVPPAVAVSVPIESATESDALSTQSGVTHDATPAAGRRPVLVSAVVGLGTLGGTDYDGFRTVGLALGMHTDSRLRFDVTGMLEGVRFKGESLLGQALENTFELSLELAGRYYLTKDNTFMGIYLDAGMGTGTLFWDYAKPVTVTENGTSKVLNEDRINYFTFFGGLGVSLIQTRYLHIGGNVIGGFRVYDVNTASGLQNDVLKDAGYMRALFEFSLRDGPH